MVIIALQELKCFPHVNYSQQITDLVLQLFLQLNHHMLIPIFPCSKVSWNNMVSVLDQLAGYIILISFAILAREQVVT